MNCAFAYTHAPISFYFKPSARDFVVEEIPLYDFSGEGEHLILKVRKKNLTTFELIKTFSSIFGIKEKEIGYAGLKDKNALTFQYLSFPKKQVDNKIFAHFKHPLIKILEQTYHHNKIKIGHLKGNHFFINLKKIDFLNNQKILNIIEKIKIYGIPNYFGYQRFGQEGNNFLQGLEIIEGKKKPRSKKIANFLISAYQSHLFNQWLSLRLNLSFLINSSKSTEIFKALQSFLPNYQIPLIFKEKQYCQNLQNQPHFFKIFTGDCLCHYPFGRNFFAQEENLSQDTLRFAEKQVSVMGLLSGKKCPPTSQIAGIFEEPFCDNRILSVGQRRYAWIFPEQIQYRYKEEEAQGELQFYLPKGAYATNFLRELAHQECQSDESSECDKFTQ